MYKLKVDLERGIISAEGSTLDMATDVLFLISEMHGNLKKADPRQADLFRRALIVGVAEAESPTFSTDPLPGISLVMRKDASR